MVKNEHFLRASLVAFASLTIVGCSGGSSSSPLPAPAPTATTGGIATGGPVAGSPIQHVIVVIQENRTMDNLFYGYPGANVTKTALTSAGTTVSLAPVPFEAPYDPSHTHENLQKEYNGGAMNGFDQDQIDYNPAQAPKPPAGVPLGFVPPNETVPYFLLASIYGLADNMFASKQVASFPGHQSLIAGQTIAGNNPSDTSNPTVWGCDSSAGATAPSFVPGSETLAAPGGPPCYDYQTLGDLLDAKTVSWKYYSGKVGTADGAISAYDAVKHIRYGADWNKNVSTSPFDFFSDIKNRTLPSVSYITPPALASDHAGTFNASGPGWVATIYQYVAESPYYNNTAILVTWDDSGGWYDHVAPPLDAAGLPLGFRVPLLVMSPYTKASATPPLPFVDHTQHDFGSIIHYIEKNWGLGSLGQRDAVADDLSSMFDYRRKPIPAAFGFVTQTSSRARSPQSVRSPLQNYNGHSYNLDYYKNLISTRPVDDDK